jgi:hypothetical protein
VLTSAVLTSRTVQVFFVHPDICEIDIYGKKTVPKALVTRTDALTLYVSRDGTDFAEVCLPTDLADKAYTMVSSQDGRGNFIIADHLERDAAISNMCATFTCPSARLTLRSCSSARLPLRALEPSELAKHGTEIDPGTTWFHPRNYH